MVHRTLNMLLARCIGVRDDNRDVPDNTHEPEC